MIQCALTNFIKQDQTLVIKDHSNSVYVNQVYSFTVLSNFNGFKSLEYLNASSRAIEPERVSDIIQSSKYSVPTKFVLLALISCGDIQSNPGPRADIRKSKRKYIFKFPCTVCGQGVRGRPIPCVCGQLTHSTCIKNLTNDLYDELKSNNEEIIYKCVFCVNNNNKLRRNQNHNNGSEIVKGAWASSQHVTTENGASQQRQQGATQGGKATSSKVRGPTGGEHYSNQCNNSINISNSSSENKIYRTQGETKNALILENTINNRISNALQYHDETSMTSEGCLTVTSLTGPRVNLNGRQSAANKDNEFSSLVNYICQLCRCNIRTKKANILCNNCLNSYHPGCFKKINIDNKSCNMCISMELPFHDFIGNGEILAVLPDDNNNNITPSEAPEDIFDVFKNKGLHFIDILCTFNVP